MRNIEFTVEKPGKAKFTVRLNGAGDMFSANVNYFIENAKKEFLDEKAYSLPLILVIGYDPNSMAQAAYELVIFSREQDSEEPAIAEYDFDTTIK